MPYLYCCGMGPCPAPGSDLGSSWDPYCGRRVLHRWDLCGVLGTPRAEEVPDCADCCKNRGSLQSTRNVNEGHGIREGWNKGKKDVQRSEDRWITITKLEKKKYGTTVNHKSIERGWGKRRHAEDVSKGKK